MAFNSATHARHDSTDVIETGQSVEPLPRGEQARSRTEPSCLMFALFDAAAGGSPVLHKLLRGRTGIRSASLAMALTALGSQTTLHAMSGRIIAKGNSVSDGAQRSEPAYAETG